MQYYLKEMIRAYIEAMRFTNAGPDDEINSDDPISLDAMKIIISDIRDFQSEAGGLIEKYDYDYPGYSSLECLAHDIWYSRNGHGTGFWDRGLGKIGDQLAQCARLMGECHPYHGGDGRVYLYHPA